MANWIFVMAGDIKGFQERIKSDTWPIFFKTHHRNEIRSGDSIIFYLAGKLNKKLLGKGTLSSGLMANKEEYSVSISNVEIWKEPLLMKKLLNSLSFIKNKDNWGMHLQGGIIPLPAEDYEKILSYGNKMNKA